MVRLRGPRRRWDFALERRGPGRYWHCGRRVRPDRFPAARPWHLQSMRSVSVVAAPLVRPLGVVASWLLLMSPLFAQLPPPVPDASLTPTVLPVLPDAFWGSVGLPPVPRQPPVHLFLMQPAFLYAPVGLDSDDDLGGATSDPTDPLDPDAELAARLQVSIGNDNPFFDFRSPDNPGRVGYYKLHAQYQVLETSGLSFCLGLQAFTPAGLESDGLAHGPTVLRPNFSWWQDMGNGCGLNGFVCKSVLPDTRLFDRVEQGYRCGLAWINPLNDSALTSYGSVHFF